MGQAALLFLLGTLIGMGGVADDPAVGLEEPVEDPIASLDTNVIHAAADLGATAPAQASTASASVEANAPGSTATVEAAGASVTVQLSPAEKLVFDRVDAIGLPAPHLGPIAGTVTLPGPLVTDEAPDDGSDGHVVMTAAPTEPSPEEGGLDGVAFTIAPAAAMAAVAAVHVAPRLGGWRRLVSLIPLFPLYSRIAREDVLDHDTRAAVYELLKDEPGCSLEEITDRLDLSRSTARHHVRVLVDAEMIAHTSHGRCRIHYPVGREDEAIARHVLANENRARVARTLAEGPRSVTEIAEALDENAGAVHFHLKKLCEAGLVERRENGSITYRAAADALREKVTFEPVPS